MFKAAWEGIYIFFLQICASSKSPDPPSENHDLGEIYSRLNHKPLECANMYLKQIFGGKWAIIPFAILVASAKEKCGTYVIHCTNKGWRAKTEIGYEGTYPTPWSKTQQRHRENSTVRVEGRKRNLKENQWKNISSPIFFFFFLKPKSTWHSVKCFSKWVLL